MDEFARVIIVGASVVSLKFVEEVQTMQRLKSNSNPPVPPFSKGDSSPSTPNPLFWKKRGKGRFSEECRGTYAANFWYRTLAVLKTTTGNRSIRAPALLL